MRITENGRVPENVQRSVKDRELAKVNSVTHVRVPGSVGERDGGASGPLPLRLTEFYTPDVPWDGELTENSVPSQYPPYGSQHSGFGRVFKLGRTTTEHWNSAVYGPSMAHDARYVRHARRQGTCCP